jgi:hypothetical protein
VEWSAERALRIPDGCEKWLRKICDPEGLRDQELISKDNRSSEQVRFGQKPN